MNRLPRLFAPLLAVGALVFVVNPVAGAVRGRAGTGRAGAARGTATSSSDFVAPAPKGRVAIALSKRNRIENRAMRQRQRAIRELRNRILAVREGLTAAKPDFLPLASVPAAVQTTITGAAGKNQVLHVVRLADGSGTFYGAAIARPGGATFNLLVSNNGALLSQEVTAAELTPDIQAAIKAQAAVFKVAGIDKTNDGTQIAYEVRLASAGGERHFTLDDGGKIERADTTYAELSPNLVTAIKKEIGSSKLLSLEKANLGGEGIYEATADAGSGDTRIYVFTESGVLRNEEIFPSQAAADVQATIKATLGDNKLVTLFRNFDPGGGRDYDVFAQTPNGRQVEFCVAESGKLLSKQEFFEDLIPAARKGITDVVGDGQIIHIERSFVDQGGVLPIVVLAHKDGKDLVFSMGPRGRFIGLED